MLTLMACMVLLALARSIGLWRELTPFERVRASACAGGTFELYRRALVCRASHDTQEFPQPREIRILVFRLAGVVPVFCRREAIGLPLHCDARVHQLRTEDFDAHFSGRFRLA